MKLEIFKSSYGYYNLRTIDSRPTEEMVNYLKESGYRWSRNNNAWYPATIEAKNKEKNRQFVNDFHKRFFAPATQEQKSFGQELIEREQRKQAYRDAHGLNQNKKNNESGMHELEEIIDNSLEYQANETVVKTLAEDIAKKIARWDYDYDDGDQSWPRFTEAYYDKNEKLIILKIYEGYNKTWTSVKITLEEFLQEYKEAERKNWITEKLNEDFLSSLSKENQLLDKTNNFLEQSSLDKASELLKGIQFTPENYKKLLNVINDITEMSGSEQLKVPTEEQVQKAVQEKEQQPQTEIQNVENEQKQNIDTFDPNAPVVFGKTVLPAFAVIVDGKLHSVENAVVKSFDKKNRNYIVDNGTEKLELPEKTFETLLKDKIEQEEKIKRVEEGRAIVFADKERGIKGTVIPEFAMYTQNGLESFKDFVPIKHNPADNSYILSNGEKTLSVTADKFQELTSNERFENKYDENSPAWKKLLEQQYKDYFEPRTNVAYNFRHNLSVFCRQHCNSPCDALHEAKNLISSMSKSEKKNTEELLKKIAHNGETTNEVIARIYHDAVKEQPLNEEYIKVNQPNNVIARPFYDTISKEGEKLDNDPALITGSSDHNLKIGSILKNVELNTEKLFGHGKDSLHFDELKVISASKEGNTITVMDSNKSFMKLPRDTVLEMYKENQLKEIKHEKKVEKQQSMSISYGY